MDEYIDAADDDVEPKIGEVIDLDNPKQEEPVLELEKPSKRKKSVPVLPIEEPVPAIEGPVLSTVTVILSRDKYFITSNGVKIQRDELTKDVKKGDLFYM